MSFKITKVKNPKAKTRFSTIRSAQERPLYRKGKYTLYKSLEFYPRPLNLKDVLGGEDIRYKIMKKIGNFEVEVKMFHARDHEKAKAYLRRL